MVLPSRDELMVSYVAVTRAKEILGIGNLGWGRAWLGRPTLSTPSASPAPAAHTPSTTPPPAAAAPTDALPRRPWTRKHDQALVSQYQAGTSLALLITTFGRSEADIVERLDALLPTTEGTPAPFDDDGQPVQHRAKGTSSPRPTSTHR